MRDSDDIEYFDYVVGCGPLVLGHRPKQVIERVVDTMRERGTLFALAHDLEGQSAKRICKCVSSIRRLRFAKSGSEAVSAAICRASAFTGKEKVIRFESHHHGWSDLIRWSSRLGYTAAGPRAKPNSLPGSNGMPRCLGETVIVVPWNDGDTLGETIRHRKGTIAAVISGPILGNFGGL